MFLRDCLHPHRLPDAAHARVEACVSLERLLATAVDEILRRIPYEHRKGVIPLLSVWREINRERQLPTLVRRLADLVVSEEHDRAEIHRAEVEEYLLARLRV